MARRFIAVTFSTLSLLAFPSAAALADGNPPPPTPSPSLGSFMAPLPDSYKTVVGNHIQGPFRASDFVGVELGPETTRALNELELDGFVTGYGVARADLPAGRTMTEWVIAFLGQAGAIRYMNLEQGLNKSNPDFQHTDPITGVGTNWFGVHLAQTSPVLVVDAFEFVKGNDLFGVSVDASRNDVLPLEQVQEQARAQYDAAPFQTIPSIEWPENQQTGSSNQGFSLGSGPGVFIVLGVIAALLAVGAFVWMRRGELQPEKPKVIQQMTADGQYWFNGTYWIATSEMAPPWAQRSKDGAFWWDGRAWQAVPRPQVPAGR